MIYNLLDELAKIIVNFPFMEVVKIPQQRENIFKILDDSNTRIKVVFMSSRKQQKHNHTKS
jgi:hypothetical protein